ncbi:hypothetical protein TruAng_008898 [Truncatella angustata]|nr:hypothetical protein TruAng_008898 [Truncatella angustata]
MSQLLCRRKASKFAIASQPIGVGFSYAEAVVGIINATTGLPQETLTPDGRYADVDPLRTTTSSAAAITAWEVLQAFFDELPTFDGRIHSREFNLWTLSYGGHYGPAFFDYFYLQNELIKAGTIDGIQLEMQSLGIFNGIIDIGIQMPYYPEFAYKNQYGLQLVNESIYDFMKTAYLIGCSDYLEACHASDVRTFIGQVICAQATAVCRVMVEGPAEALSGRSPYDIRALASADPEPGYWINYVNTAFVQNALGVDLNYTSASSQQVQEGFLSSGDWAYSKLPELENLLNLGVRVALIHGDADYLANWMGGEAISLAVNYTHSTEFRSSGYAPFMVNGTEYGESRQYGNFSFTRIYEAGHDVPFYQPSASLELFRRVLHNLAVSDGARM